MSTATCHEKESTGAQLLHAAVPMRSHRGRSQQGCERAHLALMSRIQHACAASLTAVSASAAAFPASACAPRGALAPDSTAATASRTRPAAPKQAPATASTASSSRTKSAERSDCAPRRHPGAQDCLDRGS